MNFQAIASAYDSSGSESDEDPPSGFAPTLDSTGKDREKGDAQADINQSKRVRTGNAKNRLPESKNSRTPPKSAQRLPPPPVALLGVIETPKMPPARESEGPSQPLPKRRKIEERLPARVLLPRQIQTKTPNVPTEDLQSYGISSKTEKEPR